MFAFYSSPYGQPSDGNAFDAFEHYNPGNNSSVRFAKHNSPDGDFQWLIDGGYYQLPTNSVIIKINLKTPNSSFNNFLKTVRIVDEIPL
ncbi:MAG: hypothetical protein LBS76_04705 [Mycoplasmataceae bacterium]|nr:hypothetical protein [Mycoplasmataceae bacterium]